MLIFLICFPIGIIGIIVYSILGFCSVHLWSLGMLGLSSCLAPIVFFTTFAKNEHQEKIFLITGIAVSLLAFLSIGYIKNNQYVKEIVTSFVLKYSFIPWHKSYYPEPFDSVWVCKEGQETLVFSNFTVSLDKKGDLFLVNKNKRIPIDSCMCIYAKEIDKIDEISKLIVKQN